MKPMKNRLKRKQAKRGHERRADNTPPAKLKEYRGRREKSRKKDFIRRELHEPAYPMGFYIWERHRDFPDFMPKSVLHDLWLVEQDKRATEEKARLEAKIRLTKVKDKKIAAVLFDYAVRHSFPSQYEDELAEDMVRLMNKKDVEKSLKDKELWAQSQSTFWTNDSRARQSKVKLLCKRLAKVGDLSSAKFLVRSHLHYHTNYLALHGNEVESLIFRNVSEAERGKLHQARMRMSLAGVSKVNRIVAMAGLALNKKWMEQLPTDLEDKRQRRQIEFLIRLVEGLQDREPVEVAQAMHLLPKEKKK